MHTKPYASIRLELSICYDPRILSAWIFQRLLYNEHLLYGTLHRLRWPTCSSTVDMTPGSKIIYVQGHAQPVAYPVKSGCRSGMASATALSWTHSSYTALIVGYFAMSMLYLCNAFHTCRNTGCMSMSMCEHSPAWLCKHLSLGVMRLGQGMTLPAPSGHCGFQRPQHCLRAQSGPDNFMASALAHLRDQAAVCHRE